MSTLILDNKNIIIPINKFQRFEAIINKLNDNIQKLQNNHLLNEDYKKIEFSIDKVNTDLLLSDNNSNNYLLKKSIISYPQKYINININYDKVNLLNNWKVLGEIKLLEDGEYILKSNIKSTDLPKKYRDLEDANVCEHCEQNRKRKSTYIIQNKETDEYLQVGNSCMTDFVSKDAINVVSWISNLEEKITNTVETSNPDKTQNLFSKNELIALLSKLPNVYNKNQRISTIQEYFNIDEIKKEYEMIKNRSEKEKNPSSLLLLETKIKYIDSINVTDDDRDLADDVLDFYEDLDVKTYNDEVFNITNILNTETDFLTNDEIPEVLKAFEMYSMIKNNSPEKLKYIANYFDSKNETLVFNAEKDIFFYASALITKGEAPVKYTDEPIFNTVNDVKNAIDLSRLEKEPFDQAPDVYKKYIKSINEAIYNDKKRFEYNKSLFDFMEDHKEKYNKSYFTQKVFEKIMIETKLDQSALGIYPFAEKLRKQIEEQESKNKKAKDLSHYGLNGNIFEVGEKIESIELKFINRIYKNSNYGGSFYIYLFEDKFENQYKYLNDKDLTENDIKENYNQWAKFNATIKKIEPENEYQKSTIQITRVNLKSDFKDKPITNGLPKIKIDKFNVMTVEINEKEIINEDGINYQRLKTNKGDLILSSNENFEINQKYKIAASNGKYLRLLDDNMIQKSEEEIESQKLTKKQAEKEFGLSKKKPKIN